jgi:aspartyl-tRNA(Asn)/glutamyl-tRNA(Gln) amidotransferase subunit A
VIPVETFFLPARTLGEMIRTRRLDPVELAEAYMQRLESIGPRLGAVVVVTRERAMEEARRAKAEIAAGRWKGPLHGVPYGVKDLIAAKGYPTTWGAPPYREQTFPEDAAVVAKLRDAGAVLIAKLSSVELAGGMGYRQANAAITGPGRTPWNTDFWSGGSSSGPGASIAAGLVGFALGSETSGSIVTPSAFSGATGLRPTYGRVSRRGAMALSWTLDKIGPICRTADDAGLVLSVIAGHDPLDEGSADQPFSNRPTRTARRFRIGILKGNAEGSQPEVRRNFEASIEALSDHAEIVRDVQFPKFPYGAALGVVLSGEAGSIFEGLVESGHIAELVAPEDRVGGYAQQVVLAKDYLRAMRIRNPAGIAVDRMFVDGGFDALACPTRPTVAYPVGKSFGDAYPDVRGGGEPSITAPNLLGLPGIALPNGFGENGLPTSLLLTGRAWDEEKLVALGRAYQAKTDWHTRRPPTG